MVTNTSSEASGYRKESNLLVQRAQKPGKFCDYQ